MGDTEGYTGTCDLCGKEADATVEDCMNICCMKQCHREGGDIYHLDCIKKFLGTSSKGTTGRQPKIPYSNFGCPKGKSNKTTAAEPCKGNVSHCKRIVYKNENKLAPPPVQLVNPPVERKKKEKKAKVAENGGAGPSRPAAAAAAGDAAGWEVVGQKKLPRLPAKLPQYRAPPVAKLPPIPQAPKPDPLGRNLNKDKPPDLPVGFVQEDDIKGAAGKSAKKNQKRAAKRKETGNPGIDAMVREPSGNLSGWGEGFGSGPGSEGGTSEHNPLMGNTKFITDIDAFNKLLAGQIPDSEEEYDEEALAITTEEEHDEGPHFTPEFTLREGVAWPVVLGREAEDDGNAEGWQNVLPGGRVSAPSGPSTRPGSNAPSVAASGALPDEIEQLRAALEASAASAAMRDTAANNAAAAVADDVYEQQLARALAESQRAEEERVKREKAAQAALLAQFEQEQQQQAAQHQHQQQQHRQQYDSAAWQVGDNISATPILSYSQAPQNAAPIITWPPAGPAAAPAASHPLVSFPQYVASTAPEPQPLQLKQPLIFQQQQQPAVPFQFPISVAPAAATAPLFLHQQQKPPTPAAPIHFLQQQPQHEPLSMWQQRYVGGEAPAAAGTLVPKVMAAATTIAGVDDDDTDELLALLTVA